MDSTKKNINAPNLYTFFSCILNFLPKLSLGANNVITIPHNIINKHCGVLYKINFSTAKIGTIIIKLDKITHFHILFAW